MKHNKMPASTVLVQLSDALPSTRLDLGNIINAERPKAGNANVEVLCMSMQPMPLTAAALKSMRGEAEWVRMQWLIVAVGPPGFSTAPYKSSAKEQSAGTPMYSVDDSGATVFKAWQKVGNNKDRGDVSKEVQHWSRIPAGTFITGFIREENLDTKMMKLKSNCPQNKYAFDDSAVDILPKHSFAIVEMKSSHIDNASKGQLLKLAKIMPIPRHVVPWNMLNSLPKSLEGTLAIQQWMRADEALAVHKSLTFWNEDNGKKGPCSVHTMCLSKDWFWNCEEDDKFVLVNEHNNCSVQFSAEIVHTALSAFGVEEQDTVSSNKTQQKMLDIFSACGAVHVMVQTWATQMPYDEMESVGLGIFIDMRAMLNVDFMTALNDMNNGTTSKNVNAFKDYLVMHADDDACILTHKLQNACIFMSRDCVLKGVDGNNDRLLLFRATYCQDEDEWHLDVYACELDMLRNCLGDNGTALGLRMSAEDSAMLLDEAVTFSVLKQRGISHLFGMNLPKFQFALAATKKRKREAYA